MKLDLRDKIAIEVISSLVSGAVSGYKDITILDGKEDEYAITAYKIADSMLRARDYYYNNPNPIQESATIIDNIIDDEDSDEEGDDLFEIDCDNHPEY